MSYPRDLSSLLSKMRGESFVKVDNIPVYRSENRVVIGRWSKEYEEPSENYWYSLKVRDLELIKKHSVTDFGYVCEDNGAARAIEEQIEQDNLDKSLKTGKMIHYHLRLFDKEEGLVWKLTSGESINVESLYKRDNPHSVT